MVKLFTKYASIGVLNTLIHWIIFSSLFATGQSQALSNFSAFSVAVTFSFFANAKWTFSAKTTTARYMMYVIFMGALAATFGLGADRVNLNPVVTLVSFSAISMVCGFIYSHYVIFREQK